MKKLLQQIISLQISTSLIFMPLLAAELEVDGTTNTTLDTSRNDIPIVNIANPNAKGLSHNKFTKYNVGTKGLILNNGKTTEVNTQLGGYIYGNTNLVNNAKVILNEVTSNHRSSLNGYTEIAGQKADLIIANPNGLSINGAGFINTSNITLTTGKANIVNGEIGSYSINGGDISIEGSGLNTEAQNYTAIYTHFLKLNANINAKELDIKLGLNEIDNTTKQITSSTNSNEIDKLLLDSSLLGGMYAHKIQLVGTDKGLGVNLPPEVLASSGEITITNDGKIVLHKLNATEDITIDSKSDDITLNDNIYTPKDLNITTPKNIIANNGVIKSDANFTLKADTLTNKATLSSHRLTIDTNELNNTNKIGANHLTINNKNNITNSGYIEGNNTFTITSNTLANPGLINGIKNLDLNISDSISNTGVIHTNESLHIKTSKLNNDENITANNINLSNTTLENNGTIKATNSLLVDTNTLNNHQQIIAKDMNITSDTLINNAKIQTSNDLHIITTNTLVNNGTIETNNNLNINSNELITKGSITTANLAKITGVDFNNSGEIIALSLDINTTNKLINSGIIHSNDTTNITTQTLNNDNNITANSDITIITNHITNNKNIEANKSLTIKTDTTSFSSNAKLYANDLNLTIKKEGLTTRHNLEANGNLHLDVNGTLTNNHHIKADKNLTIISTQDIINNSENNISALQALNLQAKNLTNDGTISGASDSKINITNDITNNSRISSANNLNVNAQNITNNGYFNAANDLTITSTNLTNNTTLFSGNDMYLYTAGLLRNNEDANIYAFNNLTMAKNSGNEKTSTIENISANIETYQGDINVYANKLDNRRVDKLADLYTYEIHNEKLFFANVNMSETIQDNYLKLRKHNNDEGYSALLDKYGLGVHMDHNGNHHSGSVALELKIPILRKNPSASSTIYSGGNVNFTVDSITNDISQIISSGNMHFSNSNVNNINSNINGSTKWTIDKCDGISEEAWTCGNTSSYLGVKGSNVQYWRFDQVKSVWNYTLNGALNIPTVIQSGGSITGNINKVNNGVIKESQSISGISKKNQNTSTTGSSQSNSINNKRIITKTINNKSVQIELPDITSQITLPKNNYGLFITSKNPNSKYLIESNPEFTLRANFISSDYMMEKIGFSPTQHTKKLGDAFYEQKLIRDQIFSQSGKAFLEKDIKSQQDQYTALMDNGVKVFEEFKGSELELVPGIALSKTQIDALTSDMVWMEEKIVNNQVVLVPQVYIANIESIKIDGANIIAGENIELQIADNMINKGNIAAGGDIDITAKNNIENISAEIKADNINLESKEGNIINKRFSKELDYSTNSALAKMTKVSDKGTIVANNNINIKANKSFENSGSDIKAKDINLQADDIKINTVKNNEEYKTHHIHGISKKSISSNIQSDNLTLKANNDITIEGSNLKASNNLDMEAKKVDILSAQDLDYKKVTTTSKKRFSKSSTTTTTYDLVNQSSNLNVGGKLTINTKDDTNLVSANIDAKGGANIKSEEGNVNVIAVKDIHIKDVKTQKSRFSLGISSKGISTMKIIKEHNNIEKQKSQGTLISSNKSLNIEAKENINLQGVTIDTQEGTILDGENVNIVHSEDKTITTHSKETLRDYVSFDTSGSSASLTAGIEYNKDKEKTIKTDVLSSSINTNNLTIKTKNDLNMVSTNIDVKNDLELDVGNNINVATAKNTIETTTENTKADINVKLSLNTNLKEGLDATKDTIQMIGDGTITKGIGDIANMVDSIAKGENPLEGNEDTINSANTLNNNYNTLQEGPSASSSLTANIHLEKSNTKNYQSQAVLNSMKVGNNAKLKTNQGDINLEGVKLDVKEELTLDSAKDITITSAKNTTNSDSKKDSFDGSYNLISQDITLSVNQDKSDSESIINVNSQINTNKLNIIAKNDTTLEGVNAQAQSVSVDVENLNVISQQDTQNSSSSSKGLTVGTKTIGANLSKQKENEVWTNNQTSLTGEVVTINVRNHTNTTGATIASQNQDGEDNQQLTLNTNTLTTTTLKDTSKSSNTGFGVNGNADKSTTNLTYGKSDKRQDTLATIGNGSINITDTQNSKIKELNRDITNTQKITKDKTIKTIGITVTQKSDELKAKEQENSWSKTGQRLGEGAAELVTNVGGSKETANEVAKAVEEGYEITTDKVNNVVKAIKKANGDTESSGVDIGLLPNKKNHGGFTEQIVSNFGDSDRDKKELHIVSTTNDNFSKLSEEEKATYKPIEETEYYKSLPQSKQDELKDKNLLLSETPSQSTFQNFTNGMANSEGEAIMNGLTQTHSKEQIEEGNINYTVNYNPTRGVVADTLLESSQEKINEFTQDNLGIKFLPTTATAKDTGNFIKETIKDRGNKGSNFAAHSQGNQHTKAGIENVQSNGGFGVSKKDFQRIDPNNPTKKEDNKPTYTGFGSPVNTKAMEETLQNAEIFDYKGMHTNKDDAVGEVLGGNKGKDEQMEPIERVKGISDFPKLFTDESPHSTYECDESKGMICGDRP